MLKICFIVLFVFSSLIGSEIIYTNKFDIDIIPKNRNFNIKFDNYSGTFSSLDKKIIQALQNNGLTLSNENNSSIDIKLTINYFKQTPIPKTSGGYVNVGIGFGNHGYRQKEIEVGYVLGDISKNSGFDTSLDNVYEGGTSLAIQITNKENQTKSYSTNLDYLGNYNDIKEATKDFENLVSKEISKLLFIPTSH
ncbi:hypothetical protein [Campylobacter sputorum]|uniref:hypothetical protein n=1 Tax=Campylobacter sputorum TaxID=206 RepID=UPI0018966E20|nr:hypothetical protein [Campylobacter sp. RM11259]MBF6677325.1 hypothetical protein [Campylobacter sp. RM11259]